MNEMKREEKFREKNEELEQDKKEEVKRIVRETEGDPSELAKQLSELTGLSVGSNDVEQIDTEIS